MPANFPSSPATNQTYTFNSRQWRYNGSYWELDSVVLATGATGASGVVIIRIVNTRTATFSGGITSSLSTALSGFKIYTVTAGTGTVTFT